MLFTQKYHIYNHILSNEVNKLSYTYYRKILFIFLTPVFTVTRTDAKKERANHECNSNWETKNSEKKNYKKRQFNVAIPVRLNKIIIVLSNLLGFYSHFSVNRKDSNYF